MKDILPLGKQSNVHVVSPAAAAKSGEAKQRLETRLKEHRNSFERGMMEKLVVAEHASENHHAPIPWEVTMLLGHGSGQELLVRTSFTFTLMTNRVFSQNVSKLFSKLKLVTGNLFMQQQLRSH